MKPRPGGPLSSVQPTDEAEWSVPYDPAEWGDAEQLEADEVRAVRDGGSDQFASAVEHDGADAAAEEPPEYFVPVLPDVDQYEADALGEPPPRRNCWGCVYMGESRTGLPPGPMRVIREMAKQSFGRADMAALAEAMSDYYEHEIRGPVNRTNPARPLPPWPPAQVLDHLRDHNLDPRAQLVVVLSELQVLRREAKKLILEESNKTEYRRLKDGRLVEYKRRRMNNAAVSAYRGFAKTYFELQKIDPAKLAFASDGGGGNDLVNPEVLSQGPLALKGKRLREQLRK